MFNEYVSLNLCIWLYACRYLYFFNWLYKIICLYFNTNITFWNYLFKYNVGYYIIYAYCMVFQNLCFTYDYIKNNIFVLLHEMFNLLFWCFHSLCNTSHTCLLCCHRHEQMSTWDGFLRLKYKILFGDNPKISMSKTLCDILMHFRNNFTTTSSISILSFMMECEYIYAH